MMGRKRSSHAWQIASNGFVALRFQREVDHHDRVLLHNADEQNDSDQRDHAELAAADQQRENRPDTGGRSGPAPAACKI